MENLIKYVCGIDISKDKFDCCLMSLDTQLNHKVKATHQFSNTVSGFKQLLQWHKKHCKENAPLHFLMEASGVYHEKLAIWLTENKQTVSVVLPNKARKYMQAVGLKSKNDSIDAKGLALMCTQNKFDVWQPISKFFYTLRQLTRHYQNTQEVKTIFTNQLHALQHSGYPSKEISRQLEKTIALFQKKVDVNTKLIIDHLNSNEEIKRKVEQVCKIKGVSILTVATILAETNGFELFKNVGQLVSYAGYDIIENQSGIHVGKTRISKKGNSRIRRILHMPSLNVVKFKEGQFVNLYHRVYNNTRVKMKAYVAIQKKLLVIIYTLWKKDQEYQANYNSKETSGNEESRALFPLFKENNSANCIIAVVLLKSSTTQDELRYKESSEALFPLRQI